MKKKFLIYILSFLIPVLIFFIVSQIVGYYPFGDSVMRNHDAYVQYPGFFLALKDLALYSFKGGLGINFFTTATYYLMSPLNILMLFITKANFEMFYLILILAKIGLSGLSMFILLKSENRNTKYSVLLFSTSYALCGFMTVYYYNTMWMDALYMLPLVILSINKLIKGEKKYLYVITLSLTIIINYYTGYMICIFSLLYFIFKIVNTSGIEKKKVIKDFVVLSLLCGLIACVVLLPTMYSLFLGKAAKFQEGYTNYWELNSNVLNVPYYLSSGSFVAGDQRTTGSAQIYSGVFCLIMFVLSFFNTKFSKKYKISLLVFSLIFILSFSFNLFDYAWEFFQRPIWFNHRYSFVFSFLIIYFAYKNYINIDKIKININQKLIFIIVFFVLLILSFIFRHLSVDNRDYFKILFLIFSVLIAIVYIMSFENKKRMYLIAILLIAEVSLNCYYNLKCYSFPTKIYSDKVVDDVDLGKNESLSFDYIAQLDYNMIKSIKYIKERDNEFYRLESTTRVTHNDGMAYGYNGVRLFNSIYNKKFFDFVIDGLGYEAGNSRNNLEFEKINPYVASLFNIKYILMKNIGYGTNLKTYYSNFNISENRYPLSIGFMVNEQVLDTKIVKDEVEENITNIFNSMVNKDNKVFVSYKDMTYSIEPINARINFNNDGTTYYTNLNNDSSSYFISINIVSNINGYIDVTSNVNNSVCLKNLGSNCLTINQSDIDLNNIQYVEVKKGDEIVVSLRDYKNNSNEIKINFIDKDVYEETMNELNNSLLEVNNNSKHLIEGNINVNDDKQLMFLSIPYEKGFTIKVDGKKVEPIMIFDTFLGVKLKSGNHTITIDYFPPYLKLGIALSILGVLGCVVYLKKK